MTYKLIVQKYGGSSLADTAKLQNVARRIARKINEGYHVICVVSAMGKTTDHLLSLSRQIHEKPSPRELDMLLSTGEQVSASLLAIALKNEHIESKSLNAFQAGIITNGEYTEARIKRMETESLQKWTTQFQVIVITGFQGITEEGDYTTLGRGGSDTTAVALSASFGVPCEIYSDVDGIYSIDPRIYPSAKKRNQISYDEMLELSSHGANVLHNRSIEIAKKFGVHIYCASSFDQVKGSFVVPEEEIMEQPVVTGLTVLEDQSQVTICRLPYQESVVSQIFSSVAEEKLNIDMISLIPIHETLNLSFTLMTQDQDKLSELLERIRIVYPDASVDISSGFDKISVVGIGMQFQSGVAYRFFHILQRIPLKQVTTSEIKISILIRKEYTEPAIKTIAREFDL